MTVAVIGTTIAPWMQFYLQSSIVEKGVPVKDYKASRLDVIVGTIFLTACHGRTIAGQFTPERHFGFEAAAWYWHFVDVVWLFLFSCIYVWGAAAVTQV